MIPTLILSLDDDFATAFALLKDISKIVQIFIDREDDCFGMSVESVTPACRNMRACVHAYMHYRAYTHV